MEHGWRHLSRARTKSAAGRTGFAGLESHDHREIITYSQEAWRGRMQACNGVIAFPDDDTRKRFDDELSRALAPEGEPLEIPHRISWVIGRKPYGS